MESVCRQCGDVFGWERPTAVAWIGEEIHCFCSTQCRHEFLYPKHNHRICAREGCYRRVPTENRMLCLSCYQNGDNLGEADICFDKTEIADWQRRDEEILNRIEQKVRVFKAPDMPQEKLRELVPSMRKGNSAKV